MLDSTGLTLSDTGFMPHGMCYLWRPDVLSLHVASDALIALAYFSIPFTLLYFVRKRRDLKFQWMFVCFAIFIVACGTTHLMEIWVIWHPVYWISGNIKAITALASVSTAILLVQLVPHALRLPSPLTLERANEGLQREVAERKRAESEVRSLNEALEARVTERTQQVHAANLELRREIRERQSVEEEVRSSQKLLQAIVDNSTAVVFVKDLEGRYLLVNRRYGELFHRAHDWIVGKSDFDIFPKATAEAIRAVDQEVLAAGTALQREEIAPQDDGLHTYLSDKCPLFDDRGKIYAICGISTDITERKQNERKLQMHLVRLELLGLITRAIGLRQDLASIFQVVIRSLESSLPIDFGCICLLDSIDETLTVTSVGPASETLALELGLPEKSLIAIDGNGLARCAGGQLVYEPDTRQVPFPFPQQLARGGLCALVAAPLLVESKVFGILIAARRAPNSFSSGECEFLQQLTEHVALAANQAETHGALQRAYDDLRQTQQAILQQERLRALGEMASGIAHDINNALSPVALYTDALLERELQLSEQGRGYLQVIQRSIDDVAQTVARMREFYRRREPQLALAPVQMNQLVEQVIDLTRARWGDMPQERGVVIEVRREFAPELPVVMGVESEVREALTNLMFNAIDAMPDGGIVILRTGIATEDTGVYLEVCDNGIGMDEDTRRRCLEPFFTTKGERGTGLGLAMVYGMVKRHSADIDIRSTVGEGTTVRLSFSRQSASIPLAGEPAAPLPVLPPLRILVVDDDPLLLKSLRDILEADGHEVTTANGGQEGIDGFQAAFQRGMAFAVVISDLGMPYVDGRTVASAIKNLSPSTPVILLTGWGQRLIAEGDVPAHVDRVLSKPPKLGQLRQALLACCASAER